MLEFIAETEVKKIFNYFPDLLQRKNSDGENILMKAIHLKRFELAHWCIANGSDVNIISNVNETPLAIACFCEAVPEDLIYDIYYKSSDEIVSRSNVIRNCMYAGRHELLSFFLKEKLLSTTEQNEELLPIEAYNYTHLSEESKSNIIQTLWDFGIDLSVEPSGTKLVLLHKMIENHNNILLSSLFHNYELDCLVSNNISQFAAKNRNLYAIKLILDSNQALKFNKQETKELLIEACIYSDFEILNYFISQGTNLNVRSSEDNSLIMIAIANVENNKDIEFVKRIMVEKPSLLGKNKSGEDVFDLAINMRLYELFDDYKHQMNSQEIELFTRKRLKNLMCDD